MESTITAIELLEHLVIVEQMSCDEAISFVSSIWGISAVKTICESFKQGYIDALKDEGVKRTDEDYLTGYRSAR